jgi:hypothetical protein
MSLRRVLPFIVLAVSTVASAGYQTSTTCVSRGGKLLSVSWKVNAGDNPPADRLVASEVWQYGGAYLSVRQTLGKTTSENWFGPTATIREYDLSAESETKENDLPVVKYSKSVDLLVPIPGGGAAPACSDCEKVRMDCTRTEN